MNTASRVAILQRPWRLFGPLATLVPAWVRLWRRARRIDAPDVVLVGYLGILDVHLARRLWRNRLLVLDHLAFVGDTARDRQLGVVNVLRVLDWLDRRAVQTANVTLVDTEENLTLIPAPLKDRGMVIPVGAPERWFRPPVQRSAGSLKVVFFGLYTPLQGAPVIGEAIRLLAGSGIQFTMIGHGQELAETQSAAAGVPGVRWVDWVNASRLPELVARHDVCLGILGTGDKAQRVVPTKVYQGAAAGCAIVTSDTPPQRRLLVDDALYVPPGDGQALATALDSLAKDPAHVWQLRQAAYRRADQHFRPNVVVTPLVRFLEARAPTADEVSGGSHSSGWGSR